MFSVNLQKAITCKLYIFDINFLQIQKQTLRDRQTTLWMLGWMADFLYIDWMVIKFAQWLIGIG